MTTQDPISTTICGRCGETVDADVLFCPNLRCGALLAAYAVPAGAAPVSGPEIVDQSSATATFTPPIEPGAYAPVDVPDVHVPVEIEAMQPVAGAVTASPPTGHEPEPPAPIEAGIAPAIETPVPAEPESATPVDVPVTPTMSPIAEAMAKIRAKEADSTVLANSERDAAELHQMVESGSSFLRDAIAEQHGSSVTFEPGTATSGRFNVERNEAGEVSGVGVRASTAHRRSVVELESGGNTAPGLTSTPARHPDPPAPSSMESDQPEAAVPGQRRARGGLPGWALIGLMIVIFMSAGSGMSSLGPVGGLAVVVIVIFVLLQMASATGRKTTSIRHDDPDDHRR